MNDAGTQIRFAADKNDRYCVSTNRAYLLYPLYMLLSLLACGNERRTDLCFNVVKGVWSVEGKGYENDMRF